MDPNLKPSITAGDEEVPGGEAPASESAAPEAEAAAAEPEAAAAPEDPPAAAAPEAPAAPEAAPRATVIAPAPAAPAPRARRIVRRAAGEPERYYATGKRKTSTARVWLTPGTGKITVNSREFEAYFPLEPRRLVIEKPLVMTEHRNDMDVRATVAGGGETGQAEALRHGISKALQEMDPELRGPLKRAGLLRRDARVKERKKYGLKGARARFQFSKR